MLPYHASGITPIRSSFTAETGRMTDKFKREFISGENSVRHQVGGRHFSSRDQVKAVFTFHAKQVFFELGKLACAK